MVLANVITAGTVFCKGHELKGILAFKLIINLDTQGKKSTLAVEVLDCCGMFSPESFLCACHN